MDEEIDQNGDETGCAHWELCLLEKDYVLHGLNRAKLKTTKNKLFCNVYQDIIGFGASCTQRVRVVVVDGLIR